MLQAAAAGRGCLQIYPQRGAAPVSSASEESGLQAFHACICLTAGPWVMGFCPLLLLVGMWPPSVEGVDTPCVVLWICSPDCMGAGRLVCAAVVGMCEVMHVVSGSRHPCMCDGPDSTARIYLQSWVHQPDAALLSKHTHRGHLQVHV